MSPIPNDPAYPSNIGIALQLGGIQHQLYDLIGGMAFDRLFNLDWATDAINFAQGEVASLLGLTRVETLVPVASKLVVVPADAIKILSVQNRWLDSLSGARMGKVLFESTMQLEDQKNPNWRSKTTTATAWIQMSGSTILLNGVPTTSNVLVGYIQEPTAMVAQSDSPDPRIPAYFHQFLKFAAASWLLKQAGQGQDLKRSQGYYADFAAGIGVGPVPLASVDVRR